MSEDDIRAESPADSRGYNNAHRAFVQAFLSRSVMTEDEIKPVLAAIMSAQGTLKLLAAPFSLICYTLMVERSDPNRPMLEGDVTTQLLTASIQIVNARLATFDYEIRSTKDQISKTATYALVNTASDPLTQLATTFTADEIAYIKRLLDAMFETNNTRIREILAVSIREARDLARPSRQSQVGGRDRESQGQTGSRSYITIDKAEAVLEQLVSQSFFYKSRINYYSLAPRALMELRAYLKETYNEPPDPDDPEDEGIIRIKDCEGCREIVTVGVRCSNRECGVRFHDECAVQYYRRQRGDARKCPTCKQEWTGDLFVGERAAAVQRRSVGDRESGVRRGLDDDDDEE